MSEEAIFNIDESQNTFDIITKSHKDIINECNFKTSEDEFTCSAIIDGIEEMIAETISNDKCANIPLIGSIRRNPERLEIKKQAKQFHTMRKFMTKDEYKEYTSNKINTIRNDVKEQERLKVEWNRVRGANREKYDLYAKKLGKAYADLFIWSMTWFRVVEFDKEFEEHYQQLMKE